MKKEKFLSGFFAKLAIAAMAFSSVTLTGCYKDEGLDVNGPAGTVTLPAAKYTITGTVVDANTLQLITNAKVNGQATNNGSFTLSVAPGNVTVEATADGYDAQTTTVNVTELSAGQAAVYPVYFALSATAAEATTKEVDVHYNLIVDVWNEEMEAITDATITVVHAGEIVEDITDLEAGAYMVKVSKDGYVTSVQYLTLEHKKATVAIDYDKDCYVEDAITDVILSKKESGKVTISGKLKFGDKWMLAKVIEMSNSKGELLGQASNVYAYRFEVSEDEFTTVDVTTRAASNRVFKATFTVIDENGIEFKYNVDYTLPTTEEGEGGEGGEAETPANPEITVSVVFAAELEMVKGESKEGVAEVDEETVFANEEETAATYKYTWEYQAGWLQVASTVDTYLDKATAVGLAIEKAYAAYKPSFQVLEEREAKEETQDVAVPAQTAAYNFTYVDTYDYNNLVIGKVTVATTVNDETPVVQEVALDETLQKVMVSYEGVEKSTFKGYETKDISHGHSHSHGHGHGDGNNTGGGAGDAL